MTPRRLLRSLYLDTVHRRPAGLAARRQYGGERGAPEPHEADFLRVLDWLGPLAGDRCLELGCGSGVLLERLLAAGAASAAGLDHSRTMLELARRRNEPALAAGTLDLRFGDAGAPLPWPDRAFTAACAVNMFFFLERPADVLAELHRVLAPGGRLVVVTLAGPLPPPSLRAWWVALWGYAMWAYSEEEMAGLLAGSGFAEVRVETVGSQQVSRGMVPR